MDSVSIEESSLSSPNGSAPALLAQIKADILPNIFAKYPSVKARYEGQQRESKDARQFTNGHAINSLLDATDHNLHLPVLGTNHSHRAAHTIEPYWRAWGHWLHGMPMSILSSWWWLIGIIVNDSLVLVSKYNINIKSGQKCTRPFIMQV